MKYRGLTAALWLAAVSTLPLAARAQGTPDEGAALFAQKCALCHGPGGTGTMMLGLRLGKEHGLLAERTDLTVGFVRAIVRAGLRSMPPLTRVEVTDRELAAIAAYLSRADKGQAH